MNDSTPPRRAVGSQNLISGLIVVSVLELQKKDIIYFRWGISRYGQWKDTLDRACPSNELMILVIRHSDARSHQRHHTPHAGLPEDDIGWIDCLTDLIQFLAQAPSPKTF